MKKLFSVVTALVLVCAAFFAQAATYSGNVVFFDNSVANWSTPYIHYWGGSAESTWPGVAMTQAEGNIYVYEVAKGTTGILFNAGDGNATKTGDFTFVAGHVYNQSGDLGVSHLYDPSGNGDDNNNTGEGFTIYFNNTANWTTPYIHYWGGASQSAWPGVAMTLHKGSIWKYDVSAGTTGVIFNAGDGNNTKTPDFSAVADHVYTTSSDQGVYDGGEGGNGGGGNGGGNSAIPYGQGQQPDSSTGLPSLETAYYKTNPNNQYGSQKTINMSFTNGRSTTAFEHWSAEDIIAQGVARDIAQAIKGKHERPVIDTYALFAAYDDNNLYLGWQMVYTVWDKYGEGYQPGESKPYNMDGRLMIALDVDPTVSVDGTLTDGNTIWDADGQYNTFDNGADRFFLGSTKPGVGQPSIFAPLASGKISYTDPLSCKAFDRNGYGYQDGLHPAITEIWGQEQFEYDPTALEGEDGFVDLRKHADVKLEDSAHTFYEIKIPLSDLGITKQNIIDNGIGVMIIDTYGQGAIGSLPYDPTVFDNVKTAYSKDPSSSMEKEDKDIFTYAMARVGKPAGPVAVEAVQAPEAQVFGMAGRVKINSQKAAVATVSNLAGVSRSYTLAEGENSINLVPGLYFVNVDGTVTKVIVR